MIKPIEITPLNTTNILEYKCEKCGTKGRFRHENFIINTDDNGNSLSPLDNYECPECGEEL